jgi:hypothetical protein
MIEALTVIALMCQTHPGYEQSAQTAQHVQKLCMTRMIGCVKAAAAKDVRLRDIDGKWVRAVPGCVDGEAEE